MFHFSIVGFQAQITGRTQALGDQAHQDEPLAQRIRSIGTTVSDLDRSIQFYTTAHKPIFCTAPYVRAVRQAMWEGHIHPVGVQVLGSS